MNKRVTIEQCKEAARLCHKVGLPFSTSYIINNFGEEEEDLILTEELIREIEGSEALQDELRAVKNEKAFAEFFSRHDCGFTAEEFSAAIRSDVEDEISGDEAEDMGAPAAVNVPDAAENIQGTSKNRFEKRK